MNGDAAEEIHHEEEQQDAAESNAHDGCRGEDLSLCHLDDIVACVFFGDAWIKGGFGRRDVRNVCVGKGEQSVLD